jgi:hypothetical protein
MFTTGIKVIPRMVDQTPLMSICAIMNCRQTSFTSLHVTTTNGSISDVKVNLEKVKGLYFPLLFPHREAGYTHNQKNCLCPSDYAMARMLRPEKIIGQYMTEVARYSYDSQIIDGCTGKPFESDEDINQVEQHCMPILIRQHLKINQFMLVDRLAQYWLLDLHSQICDQIFSIICHMLN